MGATVLWEVSICKHIFVVKIVYMKVNLAKLESEDELLFSTCCVLVATLCAVTQAVQAWIVVFAHVLENLRQTHRVKFGFQKRAGHCKIIFEYSRQASFAALIV